MRNKKYIIFALFIALLVIASGCTKNNNENFKTTNNLQNNQEEQKKEEDKIATSSSSDIDVKNWQVYKNVQYGFEFKYPNDWYWEDYTEEFALGKIVVGFYPNDKSRGWEYYGDIELNVLENNKKIDVEIFFKNIYDGMTFLYDDLEVGVTKSGYKYVKKIDIPGNVNHDVVYVQCGEKIISIGTPFGLFRDDLDKIINTILCKN